MNMDGEHFVAGADEEKHIETNKDDDEKGNTGNFHIKTKVS
jgi:hypothetical protein